jgi:hypothetical protein
VLVVFLTGCIAVTVALALQNFTPWLVILIFVAALPVLVRFVPHPPSLDRTEVFGSLLSLLGAAVWAVLNMPYASQLLWVTRDPAIYTVTGIWLSKHRTAGIDAQSIIDLQNQVPGIQASLIPFSADTSGMMHGQGGLTLPGLMGVGGWLAGTEGALRVNIVVGAVALVGVYALARRFVRSWLALVVQAALGLAVSFLYLMRAPYSESILLVAAMAGVVWFAAGLRQDRWGLAVTGGIYLGVGSMARIDGPIVLVGGGVLVALLAVVARTVDLPRVVRTSLAFLCAALVSCLIGLLTLHLTQRRYVNDLRSEAMMLWAAALGCVAVAGAVVLLRLFLSRRPRGGEIGDRSLRRVGLVLGAAVPVVFLFWWSRPAFWQGHFIDPRSPYAKAMASWQKQLGLPVDPTRSYDELTLHWVGWYFGWGTVVLAAIGLGIMLAQGIGRRDLTLLVLVVPTAVAATLYFDKVSVTPDQIWAYRRLLPIITPGLLVGAVYVVEWWLRRPVRAVARHVVAVVAAIVVAAGPLLSWSVLTRTTEGGGVLALFDGLCDQLTGDTVLVATGHTPINIPLTVRTVCGREVVTGDARDRDLLRRLEAKAGPVQVVAFARKDLPKGTRLGEPNVQQTLRFWHRGLVDLPDSYGDGTWRIWVGRAEDGKFVQDPTA